MEQTLAVLHKAVELVPPLEQQEQEEAYFHSLKQAHFLAEIYWPHWSVTFQ